MRSCVIRALAHSQPWPRTPADQAVPPHIFRRCPPGCTHASGLLLTPPRRPRAMRCEPAPCGSMIASSRLTGAVPTSSATWPSRWPPHVTHHHGHVTPPTQAHEFPVRLAGPESAPGRQRFCAHHRDSLSKVLCRCAARVLLFPCFTLLPHACLPLFSSCDLAVVSPLPPSRRSPVGGPNSGQNVCRIVRNTK